MDSLDLLHGFLGVSTDMLLELAWTFWTFSRDFWESAQTLWTFCLDFWDLDFLEFLHRLSAWTFRTFYIDFPEFPWISWSLHGLFGLSAWTYCNNRFQPMNLHAWDR